MEASTTEQQIEVAPTPGAGVDDETDESPTDGVSGCGTDTVERGDGSGPSSSSSGPTNLLNQFLLTDALVSADAVTTRRETISVDSFGNEFITNELTVSVDDTVWLNSFREVGGEPMDPTPDVADDPWNVVDLRCENLGPNVDYAGRSLLVGLQSIDSGTRLRVTFVAEIGSGGKISILNVGLPDAELELQEFFAATGTNSLGAFLDILHQEMAVSNGVEFTDLLKQIYAVSEPPPAPTPAWTDLAPEERQLTVDATPPRVLETVEAIGVQFEIASGQSLAFGASYVVVVQSRLGVSLRVAASVTGTPLLALRDAGETLNVFIEAPDGVRTLLGTIADVPIAKIAVVRLDLDQNGVPILASLIDTREPTPAEVQAAQANGIDAHGTVRNS